MHRRTFLKTAAAAGMIAGTGKLATPAIAQGAAARTLKFVPQANLANFDPIWASTYLVRNASQLVWDTLYGIDSTLTPKRQMVESGGGFRRRPDLDLQAPFWSEIPRWHAGTRQGLCHQHDAMVARDPIGQMLKGIQQELTTVDDHSFKWVLSKPYPKLTYALGKVGAVLLLHHAERIAKTDPFKQIEEYVGSGPMSFVRGDWKPGALAAFERNKNYVPRAEPSSWSRAARSCMSTASSG